MTGCANSDIISLLIVRIDYAATVVADTYDDWIMRIEIWIHIIETKLEIKILFCSVISIGRIYILMKFKHQMKF